MDNKIKKRKKLRLTEYNYSNNGYYFITMCVKNRECILSKVINDNESITLELLKYGKLTEKYIKSVNEIYDDIKITYYVIMPNHVHFICELENKNPKSSLRANERVPFLISTLKRLTNKESKIKIWQRNYYEHIIRNDEEYLTIIQYIQDNPYKWKEDKYYNWEQRSSRTPTPTIIQ